MRLIVFLGYFCPRDPDWPRRNYSESGSRGGSVHRLSLHGRLAPGGRTEVQASGCTWGAERSVRIMCSCRTLPEGLHPSTYLVLWDCKPIIHGMSPIDQVDCGPRTARHGPYIPSSLEESYRSEPYLTEWTSVQRCTTGSSQSDPMSSSLGILQFSQNEPEVPKVQRCTTGVQPVSPDSHGGNNGAFLAEQT